ncbi:hypothetical protein LYZ37_08435 [Vibrio tubiashii]|uniref:DUF6708 domain-containing protein n=1 Tax=Vibrio tubiashii TaxID=29498 RepID=UPI00234F77A4|nr:DUF6708 domain-containing protein [Vibrio tubiashii]WCP65916.1 hypothetical protein LYZ37_08435 [Vibrio tubiashii]
MTKDQSIEQDFNLKEQRPLAGEVRTYPLGEALFFSPKPLPSVRVSPNSLGESNQILEINDTYMDIGQSNQGKAFQAQLVIFWVMLATFVVLSVFIFSANIMKDTHQGFFKTLSVIIQENWGALILAIMLPSTFGWSAVINSSLKKARQKPIRFNRQRREVCYFEGGSKTPTIVPWEETVSWVSIYKGFTGSAIVSNVTFGIALPDSSGKDYWMFKRPVGLMEEGQRSWEIIRCYMEEEPEYWATKAQNEDRKSFDASRNRLRKKFRESHRPLFALSMSDPTASYFNMFGYYAFNILCFWKLPYIVSEWDSRISMANFPPEVNEWSKPLPREEWAKPSEDLRKQKDAAIKHYNSGGTLANLKLLKA